MNEHDSSNVNSLPLPIAQRVDQACNDFAAAFRAGGRPHIEQYLSDSPEPERPVVFRKLLALELEFRRSAGEDPRPGEYYQRFPAHIEWIDRAFTNGQASDVPQGIAKDSDEPERIQRDEPSPDVRSIPRIFGDHELIRELGRGGMGIVFEGRHRSLHKRVAVKVLPFAGRLNSRGRKRFRNEARAAAQLEHPHIVPVYSFGEEQGVDYYTMQYIEGCNLAELIRAMISARAIDALEQGRDAIHEAPDSPTATCDPTDSFDPNRISDGAADTDTLRGILSTHRSNSDSKYCRYVARLVMDVAGALQYAHGMGIVHRDIKPSNLLLDVHDHVWVTDFGLAQIHGEPQLTFTGDFVGTLRYLSPEQALAKRVIVDHRTDIYSLGVTFYELLTLRAAYDGESREEVLRQIAFHDPPAPRKVNRGLPRDLETIVGKAMSKRPDDRYQTAEDLADDLRRFLDDVPIRAKPPSVAQRLSKWAKRHRGAVASMIALWLVVFVGSVSAALLVWNQKQQLQASLTVSQAQELVARSTSELSRDPTKSLLLASAAAEFHQSVTVRNALHAAIMSLHERRMLRHSHRVGTCRFSPDGRLLATTVGRGAHSGSSPLLIWDVATGNILATITDQTQISSAVFSPDSRQLLSSSSPYDAESSSGEQREAVGFPPSLWTSPANGMWTAAAAQIFEEAFLFEAHAHVFHPDGKKLVLPARNSSARVYTTMDGREMRRFEHPGQRVIYAAYSRNGQQIATVAENQSHLPTLRVWEAESGNLISAIELPGAENLDRANQIQSVSFNPTRDVVVTGSTNRGIELWEFRTGKRLNRGYWHGSTAHFDATGDKVICISMFGLENEVGDEIDVRDTETGYMLGSFGVDDGVLGGTISADGRVLAAMGGDMATRVWDLSSFELISVLRGHTGALIDVDLRFDGRQLATGSYDKSARVWEVLSRGDRLTIETPSTLRGPVVESTDDNKQSLALASPADRLAIWDLQTRRQSAGTRGAMSRDAVSGDICITASENRVDAWDSRSGEHISSFELPGVHAAEPVLLAFAGASGWAAIGFSGKELVLWNPKGNQRKFLVPHESTITTLSERSDGKWLASGSADGVVRLWSLPDGKLQGELPHDASVCDIGFSQQGDRIVTTTDLNTASVWQLDSLRLIAQIPAGRMQFNAARFSNDGNYIITWDLFRASVAAWDARDGSYLRSFVDFGGDTQIAIDDKGDWVAIAALGDTSGHGAGGVLWNYVSGETRSLTHRPLKDIAFWPGEPQRVIGVTHGGMKEPVFYSAEQVVPREASSELLCWNLGAQQEFSFPLEQEVRMIQFLDHPARFVAQYQEHGFTAYSREDNDQQFTALGHRGRVSDLTFAPAPVSQVVTAGYDGKLMVWDRGTGKHLRTLLGHTSAVLDLDASSTTPGEIASAGADGTVRTWHTSRDEGIVRIRNEYGQAWFVQFASTGKHLLSAHRDGTVAICDLVRNDHKVLRSPNHMFNRAEFSPDGKKLLAVEGNKYLTKDRALHTEVQGKPPYFVRIYAIDAIEGVPLVELPHEVPVLLARFNANAEFVVTVTMTGEVGLWQVAQARRLRRIGFANQTAKYAEFSPDNEFVYVEFSDNTAALGYAVLFRISDGAPFVEFSGTQNAHGNPIFPCGPICPAFTPDGNWLFLGLDGQRVLKAPSRPDEFGKQIQPRALTSEELSHLGVELRINN